MLKIQVQRPSALPAVCTQVSELLPIATAPTAHAPVGYGVVATAGATGATLGQPQWLRARLETQVQGTNGFAAKQSVIGMDPDGGVRGIPPRGWPV